jgi:hypothetical protein
LEWIVAIVAEALDEIRHVVAAIEWIAPCHVAIQLHDVLDHRLLALPGHNTLLEALRTGIASWLWVTVVETMYGRQTRIALS